MLDALNMSSSSRPLAVEADCVWEVGTQRYLTTLDVLADIFTEVIREKVQDGLRLSA